MAAARPQWLGGPLGGGDAAQRRSSEYQSTHFCMPWMRSTGGSGHRTQQMAGSQGRMGAAKASTDAGRVRVLQLPLVFWRPLEPLCRWPRCCSSLPFSPVGHKKSWHALVSFPRLLRRRSEKFLSHQISTPKPTPNCSSAPLEELFHPAAFSLLEEKPFIRSSAPRTRAHPDCQAASQPLHHPRSRFDSQALPSHLSAWFCFTSLSLCEVIPLRSSANASAPFASLPQPCVRPLKPSIGPQLFFS